MVTRGAFQTTPAVTPPGGKPRGPACPNCQPQPHGSSNALVVWGRALDVERRRNQPQEGRR